MSLAPWLAVGVFGIGIVMNLCARRAPSAGSSWSCMWPTAAGCWRPVLRRRVVRLRGRGRDDPVADLVARQRTGPPAIVSFTPAFWLLVPGALGLVGVAALLNGDSTGTTTLITTVETMVAIALGVLVGRAISIIVSAREGRSSPTPTTPTDTTPRSSARALSGLTQH